MEIKIRSTSAVAIIDTLGAELKSLLDVTGNEYMWQADAKYWNRTSPFLFPNVGHISHEKTYIKGEEHVMPNHGFARDMEFRVLIQTDDKVVLSLSDTPETLKIYPYKFMVQISYSIHDCIVDVGYKVMNTGSEAMYYCIGAHPGFNCPMVEGETFSDYRLMFPQNETVSVPAFNDDTMMFEENNRVKVLDDTNFIRVEELIFSNQAKLLDELKSKQVQLDSFKTGRGVRVLFDGFEQVAIWSPRELDAPFVCIEPWCGSATFSHEDEHFEHKRGIQKLDEAETKNYSMTIIML